MSEQNSDKLKEALQQAMQNSSAPLSDIHWDKLAFELDKNPKRKISFWFWSFAIVALVLGAAFLYQLSHYKYETNSQSDKQNLAHSEPDGTSNIEAIDGRSFELKEFNKDVLKELDVIFDPSNERAELPGELTTTGLVKNRAGLEKMRVKDLKDKPKKKDLDKTQTPMIPSISEFTEDGQSEKEVTLAGIGNTNDDGEPKDKMELTNDELAKKEIDEPAKNELSLNQDENNDEPLNQTENEKKLLKKAMQNDPFSRWFIGIDFNTGASKSIVKSYARPEVVHREFTENVEVNKFQLTSYGLNFGAPIPKIKNLSFQLGLALVQYKSKNINEYALRYGTIRDSTLAIISYFRDSGRFVIKQQSPLELQQIIVPVNFVY
jgi:hypothetical protein